MTSTYVTTVNRPGCVTPYNVQRGANVGRSSTAPCQRQVIALIGTHDVALFRRWLIKDLVADGHRVIAFAPDLWGAADAAREIGADFCPITLDRTSTSLSGTLREVASIGKRLKEQKVDIVLTCSTKPNIIGSLAARRAGISRHFAMIEGLGYAFAPGRELKRRALRHVLMNAFRFAFRKCSAVFVLNEDDFRFVREAAIVRRAQRVVKVNGTGIDLDEFAYSPPVAAAPRVILIARLLYEKGIEDYVEAARIVKQRYPKSVFQLLGRFDTNPGAIRQEKVDEWHRSGVIEYLGETKDVRPYLRQCNIFCLPSFYREGVPRTILEALAIGRPIVTTDNTGCRETVTEGVNGFIVPRRDVQALARAIEKFAGNPRMIEEFGKQSRALAEKFYDVRSVNREIKKELGIYAGS